jgi:hypothetical protein
MPACSENPAYCATPFLGPAAAGIELEVAALGIAGQDALALEGAADAFRHLLDEGL